MTAKRVASLIFVVFAFLGLLTLVGNLDRYDIGTMDNPHIIYLHQ